MSYVRSVLQPNEKILVIGRLHWIVYMQAILLLVIGILLVALGYNFTNESIRTYFTYAMVGIFGVGVAVSFLHAWFIRWIYACNLPLLKDLAKNLQSFGSG